MVSNDPTRLLFDPGQVDTHLVLNNKQKRVKTHLYLKYFAN